MSNISKSQLNLQVIDTTDKIKPTERDAGGDDTISMFDVAYVKRKSGKRKIDELPEDESFAAFERPLLYYSIVPEFKWKDKRFLKLTRQEKGDFHLFIDALWQGCGAIHKSEVAQVAILLEIPEIELKALIKKLLQVGLLVERQGRYVQEELRAQYRYTCTANDNMKRGSSTKRKEQTAEKAAYDRMGRPFKEC